MMFYDSQRGLIQCCVDPDSGSELQDLISQVGVSRENALVLSVYQYSLSRLATASLLGVCGLLQ